MNHEVGFEMGGACKERQGLEAEGRSGSDAQMRRSSDAQGLRCSDWNSVTRECLGQRIEDEAKAKVKVCCGGNGMACKKPGKFSAAGQLCL